MLLSKDTGRTQVIGVQKLPQRSAIAPAGDRRIPTGLGFKEMAQQDRLHKAVGEVIVVPRAVQISRHHPDLGDGVPLFDKLIFGMNRVSSLGE